jgi:ornithine lipid ester-linked acyl 2-hydroxylase
MDTPVSTDSMPSERAKKPLVFRIFRAVRSVRGMLYAANFAFYHTLFRPTEWLVRRFSSVGQHPFFATSEFRWIQHIEAGWTMIRDELDGVLRERGRIPNFHTISPDQLQITQDDKWKTYMLYAYGRKMARNCSCCPETTRLIETIPGMKTAFFSILGPRKHIPEHRGPYTGVLRYHLGLIVPRQKEACRIRVDSDMAHWEEGRSIVFDDTYSHEVWNDTDEERVVLFVDFARPLRFPMSVLNEAVIQLLSRSSLVQNIVENVEMWNRQHRPGTTGEPSVAGRASGS